MPSTVRCPAEELDAPALVQDDMERRVCPSASENVDTAPEEANQKANTDGAGDAKNERNPTGDARKAAEEAEAAGLENAADAGREPHGPRGTGNGTGSETVRRNPRWIASYSVSGTSDVCRRREREKAYRRKRGNA